MSPNCRVFNSNDAWHASSAILIIAGCISAAILWSSAEAFNLPTYLEVTICGDGITAGDEVCDEGEFGNLGEYGSSTAERQCNTDCSGYGPYCGDNILQVRFTEECDDGDNTSGDLCSNICKEETPAPPPPGGGAGTPTRGSIPSQTGTQGTIPSERRTTVIIRGKAFPNARVNILVDGQAQGTTNADANADFIYSTTNITPGISTFGFWATDINGVASITTSAVFEVIQSAVTTVANVLIPPTVALDHEQVAPGDFLEVSGFSVPGAKITTAYDAGNITLNADAEHTGAWALQLDTKTLSQGFHTVKANFELPGNLKSGFGKSVSFYIGTAPPGGNRSADLNGDGKVNLVDFSIFLLSWNTDNKRPDFNDDGRVNLADFSIMLFEWTG